MPSTGDLRVSSSTRRPRFSTDQALAIALEALGAQVQSEAVAIEVGIGGGVVVVRAWRCRGRRGRACSRAPGSLAHPTRSVRELSHALPAVMFTLAMSAS